MEWRLAPSSQDVVLLYIVQLPLFIFKRRANSGNETSFSEHSDCKMTRKANWQPRLAEGDRAGKHGQNRQTHTKEARVRNFHRNGVGQQSVFGDML